MTLVDLDAIPAWPCCGARGYHAAGCRWAQPGGRWAFDPVRTLTWLAVLLVVCGPAALLVWAVLS